MKKALIISYLILFFLILATCAQKADDQIRVIPTSYQEQVDLVKAKQIIDNTCLECHSATASMEDRMAPPLEAVKRHYLKEYPILEDFTGAVTSFVANPTEEKALLRGAVHRFGVMPQQALSQEDILAVATYIYQFELEKPEWFEGHYNEQHGEHGTGECGQGKHGSENSECQHCKRGNGERNNSGNGHCESGHKKSGNESTQGNCQKHRKGHGGS